MSIGGGAHECAVRAACLSAALVLLSVSRETCQQLLLHEYAHTHGMCVWLLLADKQPFGCPPALLVPLKCSIQRRPVSNGCAWAAAGEGAQAAAAAQARRRATFGI